MSNNKTIVISDVHMCDRIWHDALFNKEYDDKLNTLLNNFISRSDCTELVLLGDIFETWAYPIEEKPPESIDEIVTFWSEEGRHAIKMLKECADKGKKIYFINGNHDQLVTQVDIDRAFKQDQGEHKINLITPDDYTGSHPGIRLEHGQGEDLANFLDTDETPSIQGYPFGYFVSRIFYSGKEPGASREAFYNGIEAAQIWANTVLETLPGGMNQVAKAGRKDGLSLLVLKFALGLLLDYLLLFSGVKKTDFIKMTEDPEIKVEEVYTLKDDILDYGYAKYDGDMGKLIRSLTACENRNENLKWYASQLFENPEIHLVVLGHTHERKDTEEELNYANPACFCADTQNQHNGNPFYVEIDGDNAAVRPWNE